MLLIHSSTIKLEIQKGKHMWLHKKDKKKDIYCALLATESIGIDFYANPKLWISPKAHGRFCKTKLHVFHACMVCHPPSDVHMECLYTGRAG